MSSYSLNYQNINQIIEEASDYLKKQGLEHKDILRTCFNLEEILMKYYDQFQDTVSFDFSFKKRFGQIKLVLRIGGESFDPNSNISEEDRFYNNCMQNLGQVPVWKYLNGKNTISIALAKKKKLSLMTLQLGAIITSVILGLLLKEVISSEKILLFCERFLDPVNNAIMGILGGASIFFIFFSILNGISNMGDMATFNKIGKKIFKRIFITMGLATIVICLMSAFVFPLSSGNNGGNFDVSGLWQMIIDIIPVNFVKAFLDGNTLQLSFLAVVIGIILLILDEKGKIVTVLVEDINNILMKLLQGIIQVLPISIFISIFKLIVQGDISDILGMYKYPLYVLIFNTIVLLMFIVRTCTIQHLPVKTFIKKIMPVIVIAATTSSSTATISDSFKICEQKLGIDKKIIHMGWPINNTFLAVHCIVDAIVVSLAAAECYNIPVSTAMLVTLGLNACILAMAVPKISGAMVSIYTILLGLLGIPAAAISVLIPLQIITDRINTTCGMINLHAELIQLAGSTDMLNQEILHKKI